MWKYLTIKIVFLYPAVALDCALHMYIVPYPFLNFYRRVRLPCANITKRCNNAVYSEQNQIDTDDDS